MKINQIKIKTINNNKLILIINKFYRNNFKIITMSNKIYNKIVINNKNNKQSLNRCPINTFPIKNKTNMFI